MAALNETHDPKRRSWVETANAPDSDFPVQNLPHGVFRRHGAGGSPRGGVAIGDSILDLHAASAAGLFTGAAQEAAAAGGEATLNRLMGMGPAASAALRLALSRLLSDTAKRAAVEPCLVSRQDVEMLLPAAIGDYTDFFVGIHHATNTGSMLRPESPLMPNYKWIPVAYHGRASSVVASGAPVKRPRGQAKPGAATEPVFGPSRNLDFELEMGVFIGAGNERGTPIGIDAAPEHVFGLCLLNDWSARDMQAWESAPLGPFLAKSFATTLSPWLVTMEALAPFRIPAFARDAGDPAPLPYLSSPRESAEGGFDIGLDVRLSTRAMRAAQQPPAIISRSNAHHLYWTIAQMVAHHTSNGCNLRPGDLFGTGTISGPIREARGSMIELSWRGRDPLTLPSGEERRFLEDGDEIILHARAEKPGAIAIGFGESRGVVEG